MTDAANIYPQAETAEDRTAILNDALEGWATVVSGGIALSPEDLDLSLITAKELDDKISELRESGIEPDPNLEATFRGAYNDIKVLAIDRSIQSFAEITQDPSSFSSEELQEVLILSEEIGGKIDALSEKGLEFTPNILTAYENASADIQEEVENRTAAEPEKQEQNELNVKTFAAPISSTRTTEPASRAQFDNFGETYSGHPYEPSDKLKGRIEEYQTLLEANGGDLGDAGIDGRYGPQTDGAHQAFCEQYGIDPNTPPHEIVTMAKAGEIELKNSQQPIRPEGWPPLGATSQEASAVVDGAQTDTLVVMDAAVSIDPAGNYPTAPPTLENYANVSINENAPFSPEVMAAVSGIAQNPSASYASAEAGAAGLEVNAQIAGDMTRQTELSMTA